MLTPEILSSLGSIRKQNSLWKKSGAKPTDLPNYKSCVEVPCFDEMEDEALVLDLYAPGELHLYTGIFMMIFKLMKKVAPNEADEWVNSVNVTPDGVSGDFNGNSVKTLLNNIQKLKEILPAELQYFASIFGSFRNVVTACFSSRLETDYQEKLDHFEWILRNHNIDCTPKLHILFSHVPEFIQKFNRALGIYSEQSLESLHHEYKQHADNYKASKTNPDCLVRCVSSFNANNI